MTPQLDRHSETDPKPEMLQMSMETLVTGIRTKLPLLKSKRMDLILIGQLLTSKMFVLRMENQHLDTDEIIGAKRMQRYKRSRISEPIVNSVLVLFYDLELKSNMDCVDGQGVNEFSRKSGRGRFVG